MRPFPPVDGFELIEAHSRMAFAVLRDSLVLLEFGLPSGRIEWRNDAGHRLPFDDGEAGLGEPRSPAYEHGHEYQGGNREQPQSNGAAAGFEVRSNAGHAMIWLAAALRTI